jgi:hypothetical protein
MRLFPLDSRFRGNDTGKCNAGFVLRQPAPLKWLRESRKSTEIAANPLISLETTKE